jgi:hypothetical protein
MTLQPQILSVTLPVSQAIDHVKRVLLHPFEVQKLFTIGFCAWLAHLGQQGFRGGAGSGWRRDNFNVQDWVQRARDYLTNNLYWIVPVAVAIVVLAIALWVLMVWVSSRGKFMFLHCVANDRAEVTAPWHWFAPEAASLFWFRLVLGLIQILAILPLAVAIAFLVWSMIQRRAPSVGGILVSVGLGFVLLFACLGFWILAKLTTDFVVPIMFVRGGACLQAWGVLRGLLASSPGGFAVYFLFQILLSMAIGAATLALVLVTCCLAGCLLAIPYLGTVLFLPVLFFQRAYSIFYLRQFGPDYDVFAQAPGPSKVVP